jgi:catechol 2,3-dioxygenase-like lactoylglutathione lyase family enzyme
MAQESFGLRKIGQIAVNAHDLKKMTAFYRDTLGMKFLFEAPNMAFFDCDGVRLMLSAPETPEFDHAPSILYFKVPDIRAAHRELAGRSVRFEGEPHIVTRMPTQELWMAFFRDPENNVHALMSEVPTSK